MSEYTPQTTTDDDKIDRLVDSGEFDYATARTIVTGEQDKGLAYELSAASMHSHQQEVAKRVDELSEALYEADMAQIALDGVGVYPPSTAAERHTADESLRIARRRAELERRNKRRGA